MQTLPNGITYKFMLKIYNTLTRKKELFKPRVEGKIGMYVCGMTVYDYCHIGHARVMVVFDTVARYFRYSGYDLTYVRNITDIDDKIIQRANDNGEAFGELTERFITAMHEDEQALSVLPPNAEPKATQSIPDIITMIEALIAKGLAYVGGNGDVFYAVTKFKNYGQLSGKNLNDLQAGERVDVDLAKRNPMDFVLWKMAKANEPAWQSPWGLGRPGWHIECSAMARSLLGQEIDIHTGGEDHIAVHHNNEIAQSEAASGRTFVHYWMHSAFLTMNGDKASKSLGNVVYLSDITAKGFHPLSLRYFFLQAHYRTPLSFSFNALASAASALDRLWKISHEVAQEAKLKSEPSEADDRFLAAMRDDLSTPQALGILWDSLKSEDYTPEEKWRLIKDADAHLGLSLLSPPLADIATKMDAPEDIKKMLIRRETARTSKDFKEADRIRNDIERRGYRVDDGLDGPVLTRTTL